MRRQGVAAAPGAVDDQDARAASGQQHRRGGTGAPGADDHDVVVGVAGHELSPSAGGKGVEGSRAERVARDVAHDISDVVADAVEQAGAAPVLEALTDGVEPRYDGPAAVLLDPAA